MELLVAFLVAFGVVNAKEASTLDKASAERLVAKQDLEKDYIIWEAEGDDF